MNSYSILSQNTSSAECIAFAENCLEITENGYEEFCHNISSSSLFQDMNSVKNVI